MLDAAALRPRRAGGARRAGVRLRHHDRPVPQGHAPAALPRQLLRACEGIMARPASRLEVRRPGALKSRTEALRAIAKPVSWDIRSEEHTSELQSLMRISYAVFCLKKKKNK